MKAKITRESQAIFEYPVMDFQSEIDALQRIRDHDEYTYLHSLNVARLSVNLAHRLAIAGKHLIQLGWAALLHDVGKIQVPIEILNKPKQFSKDELKLMQSHPWAALIESKDLPLQEIDSISRLMAAFEHHQRYDLQGYPAVRGKLRLHPFSRIVAIADTFDAMTSDRIYHRRLLPDIALKVMAQGFGTIFDPLILQAFITCMGAYPVGSLVRLSDNSIGVVYEYEQGSQMDRPKVWILDPKPEGSKNLVKEELKDLKIIRSEFPEDHGISIPKVLREIEIRTGAFQE